MDWWICSKKQCTICGFTHWKKLKQSRICGFTHWKKLMDGLTNLLKEVNPSIETQRSGLEFVDLLIEKSWWIDKFAQRSGLEFVDLLNEKS